jgi:prepilin-type N-terminal cleavage/methylation domain-containing protein
MKSNNLRSGFTLIEVMAAIVLLTIVVGGVVGAQIAATNLTRSARDTSIAVSDAQAALEEILIESIDDIPVDFPAGAPIARWNDAHLTQERIIPTYPNMAGFVPDPLEIRVTLTWTDFAGRARSLTLDTVKVR